MVTSNFEDETVEHKRTQNSRRNIYANNSGDLAPKKINRGSIFDKTVFCLGEEQGMLVQ